MCPFVTDSGRMLALNLNGPIRADRIDTIDFFLPDTRRLYTYMYGAACEQFWSTLLVCMNWNAIVRSIKKKLTLSTSTVSSRKACLKRMRCKTNLHQKFIYNYSIAMTLNNFKYRSKWKWKNNNYLNSVFFSSYTFTYILIYMSLQKSFWVWWKRSKIHT